MASFARWCADQDLGLTLTTSGGPLRRLREWMELPHRGLTLSIHSGTEETRAKMVPKGPPLGQLFETIRDELGRISNMRRKRLALAYLLIKDRNDSDEEFDAFLDRVDGLGIKIHLYAYNPVPTNELQGITEERYSELYWRVRERGLDVRKSSQARVQETGKGEGGSQTLPGRGRDLSGLDRRQTARHDLHGVRAPQVPRAEPRQGVHP